MQQLTQNYDYDAIKISIKYLCTFCPYIKTAGNHKDHLQSVIIIFTG